MDNVVMNKALINAQKCVLSAVKDGNNPAFKSKYATLDSVLAAIRGPLCENGFALVQDATSTGDSVSVITKLLHESGGELVSLPLSAPLKKEFSRDGKECPPSVQQIGSLVTYLRRYSLCPFLGVSLDDDDDGAHASGIGKDTPPAKTPDAAPAGNRKSAHTGEPLNSAEAVAKHKEAAAAAGAVKPTTQAVAVDKPKQSGDVNAAVANKALRDALNKSCVVGEQLEGYLKGAFGDPVMGKPVLTGNMGLDSLGDRIVESLLKESNWNLVVTRIKADPRYLPF